MFDNMIADYKAWFASPYHDDMNLYEWFLFIGLMAVLTFAWSRILGYIAEEI